MSAVRLLRSLSRGPLLVPIGGMTSEIQHVQKVARAKGERWHTGNYWEVVRELL